MLALKSCFAGLTCRKFEPDLAPPADVVDLFRSYCGNKPHMDAIDLQRFLTEVQREADYETQWQAQALMDMACNRKQKGKHAVLFSLDDFFNLYLFNDVLNGPIHAKVHHDMTQPMSHYYIFTGHNSYLTGNQLSSDCSVEPIIEALRRGVRVIELDLWPNSTRDGIHVKHGGTLTAPVDFEECIRALKDYAFVKSSYPVIITFEDHLTASLQAEAAKIVHRVLGKLLYSPAPPHEGFKEFPSPKSLMGRILISTKPPKEYLEMLSNSGSASMARAAHEESSDDDDLGNSKEDLQTKSVGEDVGKEEEEAMEPEYGNLIAIRAGKADRWRPLKDALISDCYVKRVSLSEPELSKVVKSHPDVVLGFTRRNLLRIYPRGIRVDSSNYDPVKALSHGAQMLAFNMQGHGRPLWLIHGLFRANGGSGYVKKPSFLIDSQGFNPMEPGQVKKTLKVKIYQGKGWLQRFKKTHFDLFTPPDFYIRVGIAGVKADIATKRTGVAMDDWTPRWDEEFEFPLRAPELALLRLEVREYDPTDKDDFGGQTCLPVPELKCGIRAIPLYDKGGRELSPVKLLMRFDLT